jgi:hypothetical protein
MGTKELGWSSSRILRARFLALALSVSSLAASASARTAYAADQKKVRDKIVDLNKQALLSFEAKDFDTARDLLTKALKEAKQAGLEDDKMTARTYLHLGAVYSVGFRDQTVAIQNFTLAKKIRPDIQLTPSIETPDLKAVFDQAAAESEPTPGPTPEPTHPARPLPAPRPEPTPMLGAGSEPDLPSTMPSPLMCSTPEDWPPGKDLLIRCAVKPGINAKSVQLHYRALGAEAYQTLPMPRSAKGWYRATIPGHAMKGEGIQIYYDARDGSDNELASNGQSDSPSAIEIRKKGGGAGAVAAREGDPLANIKKKQEEERYEAGLHRRREGAFWLSLGGGMGWGYAPAGNLEWAKNQQGKPIKVSAVTTTTGMLNFLGELGYMVTENFSLAVQVRLEFIRQDQITSASNRSGAPATKAPAFFLRALYFMDVSASGNFQFCAGLSGGGGYVRFPVKPQILGYKTDPDSGQKVPDPNLTIAKTDTRPMGVVLLGPSAGFALHVSRHFSILLDARALMGLPDFGVAFEGYGSLLFALGGKAGPAPDAEEGEGEGESGASGNESPGATETESPSVEPEGGSEE